MSIVFVPLLPFRLRFSQIALAKHAAQYKRGKQSVFSFCFSPLLGAISKSAFQKVPPTTIKNKQQTIQLTSCWSRSDWWWDEGRTVHDEKIRPDCRLLDKLSNSKRGPVCCGGRFVQGNVLIMSFACSLLRNRNAGALAVVSEDEGYEI